MDQNQDTTDLMKCMEELEAWERRTNAATHPVLICGALSGRFDHMMHTVHFLHQHTQSQRQIFLISDENIACLLDRVRPAHIDGNADPCTADAGGWGCSNSFSCSIAL